jgi:hypothetical protein
MNIGVLQYFGGHSDHSAINSYHHYKKWASKHNQAGFVSAYYQKKLHACEFDVLKNVYYITKTEYKFAHPVRSGKI